MMAETTRSGIYQSIQSRSSAKIMDISMNEQNYQDIHIIDESEAEGRLPMPMRTLSMSLPNTGKKQGSKNKRKSKKNQN